MRDLIPCTARQFDIEVIRYASMDGWTLRNGPGLQARGYVNGRLVLLLRRKGNTPYAEHFMAPRPQEPPRVLLEGFRYR